MLTLALTACAPPPGDAPSVQVLLDAWAAALLTDDVAALYELVDPDADPSVLDRQLDRARNMAAVPFAEFGFELAPDLDAGATRGAYLYYAIEGPDAAPTRRPMSVVVAHRAEGWKLVSDGGAGQGPWDFGPVVATRIPIDGTESVILAHPEQREFAGAVGDDLPAAVRAVSDVWGRQWRRAVVVVVAGSAAEFAAIGGVSDPAVAAVSVSDEVVADAPPTGQRIVFSPEAPARLTDSMRPSVLRHELTHVAARAQTAAGSPMWVLEGFADYVGYRNAGLPLHRVAPNLIRMRHSISLPSDAEFGSGTAVVAYEKAWSAWSFVADRFGDGTVVPLYRALTRGAVDAQRLDAVLREILGVSTAEFIALWNEWIDDHR